MAEEMKDQVINQKSTTETETAPVEDKTVETPEQTDTSDTIDEVLMILNIINETNGGSEQITEIPDNLQAPLQSLINDLKSVRVFFEDPLGEALIEDIKDQMEDGSTPSVEVAVARNIPIEKLQALAENEDYTGAQNELRSKLEADKMAMQQEADYESSFEESKAAGEAYAAEMGYNEEEKNALFQRVLDWIQVLADGKLTKEEFRKIDKGDNYDADIADLKSQIPTSETKEVLPDKASVEAAMQTKPKTQAQRSNSTPGMASIANSVYNKPTTDYTKTGQRKRQV